MGGWLHCGVRDTLYVCRILSLRLGLNICLCLCVSLFLSLSLSLCVFVFVFVCLCGWLALAAVPCVRVTLTCYAIKRTQRTAHRILLQSIHRSELLPQLLPTDFSWFSVNPTCNSVTVPVVGESWDVDPSPQLHAKIFTKHSCPLVFLLFEDADLF